VYENRVLRRREEVAGTWRRLHNEIHNLYASPNINLIQSRRMRLAGQVAHMGDMRNAYKIFVGKPEGKRPLGRHRYRWEDNIRMDVRELGQKIVDWIHVAQHRDQWRSFLKAVTKLRVS
jgi:hypothetical protein